MDHDLLKTTNIDLSSVESYEVASATIDEPSKKATWNSPYFRTYSGYYTNVAQIKQALDSLVMWVVGRGYTTQDPETEVMLEGITGNGAEDFIAVMANQLLVALANGDSFSEVVRLGDKIINLKPISPDRLKIYFTDKGIIDYYEETLPDGSLRTLNTTQVFHLVNNRYANSLHGTSVFETLKDLINWLLEMMKDWRRLLHLSTIRILYIDADNTERLTQVKTEYASGIANGTVLIIPAKKGEAEFQDLNVPPSEAFLSTMKFIENYIYKCVGVPEVIMGGSQQYTEAASKVGYMTFEQPYKSRQRWLESALWNQLQIKLTFNEGISMKEDMQQDEAANTGQVAIRPNDVLTGGGV